MSKNTLRPILMALSAISLVTALAACAFVAAMRPPRESVEFAYFTVICCGLLSAALATWAGGEK